MEKEFTIFRMAISMMESGKRTKGMDMGCLWIIRVEDMRESG